MKVIENATIVGRSFGERNVYVIQNESTGKTISMLAIEGEEFELGTEGEVIFDNNLGTRMVSFLPAMEEAMI